MELTIDYIGHSGFGIGFDDYYLLFDYYTGDMPYESISNAQHPMIFASHAHADHFNKKIFTALTHNENTRFILSDDIKTDKKAKFVKPDQNTNIGKINIQTFDSSDQGVCYLVTYKGIKIFHAGDLNLWSWRNESTQREIDEATTKYLRILNEILRVTPDIDIVFFPVDARMKTYYEEGAVRLLESFNIKHFFPMHMWGKYNSAKVLAKYSTNNTSIYKVTKNSKQFYINIGD